MSALLAKLGLGLHDLLLAVGLIVVSLSVVAGLSDWLTVVHTYTWLDPARVPLWMPAAWAVRGGVYLGGAVWLARRDARGAGLLAVAHGSVIGLWLSPWGSWMLGHELRQNVAAFTLVLLLAWVFMWSRSRSAPESPAG